MTLGHTTAPHPCPSPRGGGGRIALLCGSLVLAALLAFGVAAQVPLDRPAPDVAGGPWLNSQPLATAGLRGRVVFVEFWTYG